MDWLVKGKVLLDMSMLLKACEAGDLDLVKRAILDGDDIDEMDQVSNQIIVQMSNKSLTEGRLYRFNVFCKRGTL